MWRKTQVLRVMLCLCTLTLVGAARAQTIYQLTQDSNTIPLLTAIDDAGTTVYVPVATNQLGNNPDFKIQLFKYDATTGVGTMLTTLDEGISAQDFPENFNEALPRQLNASDDGQWLAFLSVANADLVDGDNQDRSTELFVMKNDGTMIDQLTSDVSANAGDLVAFDIDGTGNKLFFFARQNPPSENMNPNRYGQLFSINRDGSGVKQLTQFTSDARCVRVSVSDDGNRVVFSYAGTGDWDSDGTIDNPDGSDEIFKINGDGSGLIQMTEGTFNSVAPHISGDGSKIAFQSREDHTPSGTNTNPNNYNEVYVMDWDGSSLVQVLQTDPGTSGGEGVTGAPMLIDDGSQVYFHSNHGNGPGNSDVNSEIYKIDSDGNSSSLVQITDSLFNLGCSYVVPSGDGSRVAFVSVHDWGVPIGDNSEGSTELYVKSSSPSTDTSDLKMLTDGVWGANRYADISSDGTTIVYMSKYDPLGSDEDRGGELYRVDRNGNVLSMITALGYADRTGSPSVSGDGQHIAFITDCDMAFFGCGDNSNGSQEAWYTDLAGTTLVLLSDDGGVGEASKAESPVISDDGQWIFWEQNTDFLSMNGDLSREIFRSDKTANQRFQLTSGASGRACRKPRTMDDGTWVAFECNGNLTGMNADNSLEVFLVKFDGTGTVQITNGGIGVDSVEPDISGDGSTIVYASSWNQGGMNGDGNQELFKYDVPTKVHTQLTFSTSGRNWLPRMSNDGRYAYFLTTSDTFETDVDIPIHQARIDLTTSEIIRVGGIDDGNPTVPLPNEDGSLAVFSGIGNFTRQNYDMHREVWLIDMNAPIEVSLSGPAPTSVSWPLVAGALRYDVIRGNVASLAPGVPGTTDLGAVVCLEDNTIDTDTVGDEDGADPPTGQAFFYAVRAIQGLNVGPSHYGESSNGDDRNAGSGNCSF